MAKRLFSQKIFNSKDQTIKSSMMFKKIHTQIPTKEVKIPVKYGHIAGKLWGSGDARPILALHGWQDNAGTWDPLIPKIMKDRPILAVDFPGHGFSSWIPPGLLYYQWELTRAIFYVKQYFNWDKVSLLTHSMGAISAMRYASVFTDEVDFYIALDSLVFNDYNLNERLNDYPEILKKGIIAQDWLDQEPPSYSLEKITKSWHLANGKSISLDGVQHLLKRGVKQSSTNPSNYAFTRDPRLKYSLFIPEDKKFIEGLIRRLKCPTLFVKAIDSPYSADKHSTELCELLGKLNDKYELQFVPGTHHVHLNNPEVVVPVINNFINKHNLNF